MDEQTETPECKPCTIGLAVLGIMVGCVFLYIAFDVLTNSGLTRRLAGREQDTAHDES